MIFNRTISSPLAVFLPLAVLMLVMGSPLHFKAPNAAQLTNLKDTLSSSNKGGASNHTLQFDTPGVIQETQVIQVIFPAGFDSDSIVENDVDIEDDGVDLTTAASCAGIDQASVAMAANTLDITICSGDGGAVATGSTVAIKIGQHATTSGTGVNQIINPTSTGSYNITVGGTQPGSGRPIVAIVDPIVMTASVDTNFTFTITPTTTGTINGDATTLIASTTTTTIPFGTLSPGVAKAAGHILSVATNAKNGFAVTLRQDQNLLSSTGADIDLFADGASTSVPVAWKSPSSTLDQEATYGHYGITSEDATLTAGDEFGGAFYAGNIGSPREVLMHTGPSDGLTPDKGMTKVAVKIEIGALQEAGNDYTNTLTYVATPTF